MQKIRQKQQVKRSHITKCCLPQQFETKIESIHGLKELQGDVVVVFVDGSVSIVNHAAIEKHKLEPRKSTIPNSSRKKLTLWSESISLTTAKQKETNSLFLLNKLIPKTTTTSYPNLYELEHITIKDESPFISFYRTYKIQSEGNKEESVPISCSLDSSSGVFAILCKFIT